MAKFCKQKPHENEKYIKDTVTDESTTGKDNLLAGFIPLTAVAKALGVSKRTMQRYHAQRIGPPCIRIGNTFLCRIESVHSWLISREIAPARPRR
ncbi:hypothetical protein H261_21189 [Paramagnetospirillum caucaseum]|uniref:Helix-turn-helix domain-containing protein n=1 Tax=Paramagnetospirillum caucaseum TaxID=1244869 RepID=M2Z0U9_9PROT|nr:hypothetical protein H261_21189 [Paramagnetospirillum caucaseum]